MADKRNWNEMEFRRLNVRIEAVFQEYYGDGYRDLDLTGPEEMGPLLDALQAADIAAYRRETEKLIAKIRRGELSRDLPRREPRTINGNDDD